MNKEGMESGREVRREDRGMSGERGGRERGGYLKCWWVASISTRSVMCHE